MEADRSFFQARPRHWLELLTVLIAISVPLLQALLIPWFESFFAFPIDRFASLWPFWIGMVPVLGIAHYAEGFPLADFGFRRTRKTLRARLVKRIPRRSCFESTRLSGWFG